MFPVVIEDEQEKVGVGNGGDAVLPLGARVVLQGAQDCAPLALQDGLVTAVEDHLFGAAVLVAERRDGTFVGGRLLRPQHSILMLDLEK